MKLKPFQRTPLLIACGVIVLVCLLRWKQPGTLESLEDRTYDWRVRLATNHPTATATNLGFIAISDESIARLNDGSLGFHYAVPWPRLVYGLLLRELSAEGAKAAGFDILFAEPHPRDDPAVVSPAVNPSLLDWLKHAHPGNAPVMADENVSVESDDFLAWQLHESGIGIVASEKSILPHPMFRDPAAEIGDISVDRDGDSVLREVRAFRLYRFWNPIFEQAAAEYKIDLSQAKIEPRKIVLATADGQEVTVPLAEDGTFDPVDFAGPKAAKLPRARPYSDRRVWHMGIVLAARALNLDLDRAQVDLAHGRIVLPGADGSQRVIPVSATGSFYIDWVMPIGNPALVNGRFEDLLERDRMRMAGVTNGLGNEWRGKVVMAGSTATGNNMTDLGATSLEKETCLVSVHWNVANSVITNWFIRRTSAAEDCLIILLLGGLAGFLTLRLRPEPALGSVLVAAAVYTVIAVEIYVYGRIWLPLFLPLTGAMLGVYLALVTWRVLFEQTEKRRIRHVFSKVVAREIMDELLAADSLKLGGARREITVFFADVRGFTAFTDISAEQATQVAREKNLTGAEAEEHFDREATETLGTVNAYLAIVANNIKQHGGTLDKYIGDCVMAFWNAPAPDPKHALHCVRAAIDSQRAIDDLNRQRAEENTRREAENLQRAAAGEPPLPMLPILLLGSGINTGPAIYGLMGSDEHGLNCTVFGREINLASRLESLSGRGRILVGELTFAAIQRDDPALAATCSALPPVNVKGIREAVKVFEVPWRLAGTVSPVGDDYGSAAPSVTTFFTKPK